ncbi:MAG: hypothetical protein OIF58_00495 [Cohaesibacter sp.]|nr:hypothetical protein [Cohaesibacter sp.]
MQTSAYINNQQAKRLTTSNLAKIQNKISVESSENRKHQGAMVRLEQQHSAASEETNRMDKIASQDRHTNMSIADAMSTGAKEIDTRTCQSQMQWAQVQRMSQINNKHTKRHTGRQLNPANTKNSTLESSQNLHQNNDTKIKIAKQPQ